MGMGMGGMGIEQMGIGGNGYVESHSRTSLTLHTAAQAGSTYFLLPRRLCFIRHFPSFCFHCNL